MDTMKAVRVDVCGAAEQMLVKDVPLPKPGMGEVRIRLKACGINLIDTYHRSGLYPLALPTGLGCEGAGLVDALGEGIDDLIEGDRVGFAMAMGAYAEAIVLPRGALVKIPAGVTDEEAAAVLLKAMTVDYLFNDTFPLSGGETVLFHAAAGGVGLIACQWARHKGVKLIGTASTQDKCDLAVSHGAEACLLSDDPELSEKLRVYSPEGYPVVYDSVGRSTYRLSLGLLAPWVRLSVLVTRLDPLMRLSLESWPYPDHSILPAQAWLHIWRVRVGCKHRLIVFSISSRQGIFQ